jgi:hypothetical protein
MNIKNMAVHAAVCQKSEFYGNSDFQNFYPLQIPAKTIYGQNMLAFQRYFGARS